MELSAKLTLDTGPFAAALADALKAVEALAAETGGLSKAVAEAQSRLAEMAEEASKASEEHDSLAAAEKEAADASGKLADANKEAAESEGELAEQADNAAQGAEAAKAATSGLSAASAAASGNISGAAQSALGLGKALQSLGMAAKAVPFVALAAALAAAAVKLVQMRNEARQMRLDEAFDRARKAASNLAEEVDRINSALSRQASLSKALKDVADSSASKDERIALANLERRRQEALRGKSAEERVAIDADFDLQRNALVRDNAAAASGRATAEMGAQRGENEAQIERLRGQMDAIRRQAAAARGRAASISQEIGEAGLNPFVDVGALQEAQKRENDHASGLDKQWEDLSRQVKALEDANTVLGAKIEAAAKDVELADAEKAAADAAIETSLANAAKEASEAVSAGSGKAGGVGGEGRIASDRLTRIGGYMGGSSPMKTSEDLLRKANEQRAEMIAAIRDMNGGTFA
jgi:predicted  nucleic acid-binding Zn-ribbon protein